MQRYDQKDFETIINLMKTKFSLKSDFITDFLVEMSIQGFPLLRVSWKMDTSEILVSFHILLPNIDAISMAETIKKVLPQVIITPDYYANEVGEIFFGNDAREISDADFLEKQSNSLGEEVIDLREEELIAPVWRVSSVPIYSANHPEALSRHKEFKRRKKFYKKM